jgi:Zn-dependent peptidase ImmA (M78 family)/transcriptional regulator with XRE-family HTH domain
MNRLRAYRAIEGISQEELGDLLGLSPSMISMIEGGRRPFGGDLAALGYSNERFELPEMSEPLHRQRASASATAKKRAQELLRLAGEVFRDLRARTERAPHLTLEPFPPSTSNTDIDELATEVRYALRHEEAGPIRNLTAALERAGVCVVPIVGLDGMDGLSSWVAGVPVIGVSPSVPGDRFRLTLGHELAHLLLHTRRTETTEGEANRFASTLLFPSPEFDAQMPSRPQLRDFVGLKSSWGVSVAALVYRAHEMEFIDDRRYRQLQIQMSKWRRSEPGTFQPVHGELMNRLVEANGGLTDVARDLGVRRSHLIELCNWSHLRVA